MRQNDFHTPNYLVNVDPTSSTWFTLPNTGLAQIDCAGLAGLSISIKPLSGTVNGQFKCQTTNFGDKYNPPVTADWCDYASAQPSAAGVISSTIEWDFTDIRARWVRVVFTDNSSSSPKVSVAISGRALG